MRLAFLYTVLFVTLLSLAQVNAADPPAVEEHRFNNAIAFGISGNVRELDSSGIGLNVFEYGRRIHGRWFGSIALGGNRRWAQTGTGSEQIETKSLTGQLSYGLKPLDYFDTQFGIAVFAAVSQDFSSFNVTTGMYNQDLATTVGGGVSFAVPITNQWAAYLSPQFAYDLTSTELAFETEIGLAYAF